MEVDAEGDRTVKRWRVDNRSLTELLTLRQPAAVRWLEADQEGPVGAVRVRRQVGAPQQGGYEPAALLLWQTEPAGP
jgi:hypothetical protein